MEEAFGPVERQTALMNKQTCRIVIMVYFVCYVDKYTFFEKGNDDNECKYF